LPCRLAPLASVVVLLGLLAYLFWVPLRPVAWGGPRGAGPFETEGLPAAGRFARTVRLPLEQFAAWRSPDHPLEATAEILAGFHALLAAARLGILWLILWRLGGRGCLATLGVLAAALPMIAGGPRQDEADVGLLLFVTLMAATTPARIPWVFALVGLPALFVLWANAHPSAVVGLAWLGVVTVGRTVEWWKTWRIGLAERPAVRRLMAAIVLCPGATCLNPDGPNLFVDAFVATKNPNIHQMPEWQPINFSTGTGMPWGYFATLTALFVAQLASRRVLGPLPMLVILTFGFWPVLQQRGLGYWWLIVPWLAVPLVAEIGRRWCEPGTAPVGQVSNLSGQVGNLSHENPGSGLRRLRWMIIALTFLIVVTTPFARWVVTGQPRALEDTVTADTPWRVARELTAGEDDAGRYLPGLRETVRATYPNGRYRGAILTGEAQGDFLAWVLDGDNTQPVVNYSRPDALNRGHWGEVHGALESNSDWWEILGRHQVNLVVIDPRRRGKLADRLRGSQAWRMVEESPVLLVAVRREPKLPAELQR
jgi:hypothetical protein